MTQLQYKQRSGELRGIVHNRRTFSDNFAKVHLDGTDYIYNKNSHNIIFKYRLGNGGNVLGIQYRATSIYRPLLETLEPTYNNVSHSAVRRVASPNMRKHVRDVRALVA
jgi:hypothetical protein